MLDFTNAFPQLIKPYDFSLAYWCGRLYCFIFVYWTNLVPQVHNLTWLEAHWLWFISFLYIVIINLLTLHWWFCVYVQKSCWSVALLSCNICIPFWCRDNADLMEWIRKCFLCFLQEILKNWYHAFFKYLIKFTSETM